MSNKQLDRSICSSIVERRSGYGWTSGAGDRAGAYTALCGKPTVDGTSMCRRHLNAHRKMQVLLAAKRERDLARLEQLKDES
jgi:hypothetical protein